MKKFEAPELGIIRFSAEDIITTSREDELPLDDINEYALPITGV